MHWTAGFRFCFIWGVIGPPPVMCIVSGEKKLVMNQQAHNGVSPDDMVTLRRAANYARALTASLVATALSLYGALYGPQWLWIFGVAAFLLAVAILPLSHHHLGIRFVQACPDGLSGPFPRLRALRLPIAFSLRIVALSTVVSLVTMLTAGSKGVGDGRPVFAPREHYVLTNHSKRTEVSRHRYWVADSAGHAAWHTGVAFGSLMSLYAVIFGSRAVAELYERKTTKKSH
jgi:hypothetical protein